MQIILREKNRFLIEFKDGESKDDLFRLWRSWGCMIVPFTISLPMDKFILLFPEDNTEDLLMFLLQNPIN